MLSADSDFERWPGLATAFGRHLHQLPNAFLIQGGERILFQDALGKIGRQHFVDVVTREAERGLREIVGPEREELRLFGDLVRHQSSSWQLDHRANQVFDFGPLLFEYFLGHAPHDSRLVRHFFHHSNQRNHDLGQHLDALLRAVDSCFENGASLHLGDFGIRNAETTAAVSEHGVELVQLFHASEKRGQELLQIADALRAVIGISLHQFFFRFRISIRERGDFHH